MDTLLHTYRSDEDDEEEIPIPSPNPNPIHILITNTQIESDPVHDQIANTQMDSDPVEKTQMLSDPVEKNQMESDPVEKTQMESDPVHDQITNTQMESDPVEKTQMESDPVHDQITNTQMKSNPVEGTQIKSNPVHDQITNTQLESDPVRKTQMVSDPVHDQITNTQMESDPFEKTQIESDPVHNQLSETQMVSEPVHNLMTNTQMDSDLGEKTQMESDPVHNNIMDTQSESHLVEKTQMDIDPVDEHTTKPMAAESAEPDAETKPEVQLEPELMVVEQGENVGGEIVTKVESLGSEEVSTDSISEDEQNHESSDKKSVGNGDEESSDQNPPKKQKSLSQMGCLEHEIETTTPVSNKSAMSSGGGSKKKSSKKKSKNNNVWTKPTSRKGKKKAKNNNHIAPKTPQDMVYVAPIPRFPDRNDDSPDAQICLSKFYKAEKVEISEDRLSASSCKGYRMVRATRGVTEGAWYFEIKVVHLGETGHTRLGWSNEKGDLQAPVGYDTNSFGYRDIDGSKIHKALREKYGEEGYKEGDVIGFYINLPQGNLYAPKPAHMVWYKGQKFAYAPDTKNDPQIVPGSEISFFKNGVCQGVAYKDLHGGCYYPAASMYTLPNQPNCTVKFNFGPDFECFPADFDGRPTPSSMIEVPYHGFDNRGVENGVLDETKM